MYLFERAGKTKNEILCSLVHMPHAHNSQCGARWKPGIGDLTVDLPHGSRDPSMWSITCCLPGKILDRAEAEELGLAPQYQLRMSHCDSLPAPAICYPMVDESSVDFILSVTHTSVLVTLPVNSLLHINEHSGLTMCMLLEIRGFLELYWNRCG